MTVKGKRAKSLPVYDFLKTREVCKPENTPRPPISFPDELAKITKPYGGSFTEWCAQAVHDYLVMTELGKAELTNAESIESLTLLDRYLREVKVRSKGLTGAANAAITQAYFEHRGRLFADARKEIAAQLDDISQMIGSAIQSLDAVPNQTGRKPSTLRNALFAHLEAALKEQQETTTSARTKAAAIMQAAGIIEHDALSTDTKTAAENLRKMSKAGRIPAMKIFGRTYPAKNYP